jgi:hypothetical protein
LDGRVDPWQPIGNCAARLIGLSRTEDKKRLLLGRFDLDPWFVAVGVVADHLKAHFGGPELQGGELVCDRNDDSLIGVIRVYSYRMREYSIQIYPYWSYPLGTVSCSPLVGK